MISFSRLLPLANRGIKNFFKKFPFCVSFEVTHSCNAHCKHCHLGGPVKEQRASPEDYGEICREIKPLIAQLSGGEPLLRKDLEQIVKALRIHKKAPYLVVTTNGVLLTKERYFRLREAGVDEFSISLDYPDERHDEFRQIPGLFRRIEKLITELKSENDKPITLCCVVQSDNYRDLPQMAKLAKEWNVKISFSAYTTLRTKNKKYMIPKEELKNFRKIIEILLEFKKRSKSIFTSDYIFKRMPEFFENGFLLNCQAGNKFFNINPDGSFSPCGLIITDYKSHKELKEKFSKNNACIYCYTSIRGNSEKPPWYLIKDSFKAI